MSNIPNVKGLKRINIIGCSKRIGIPNIKGWKRINIDGENIIPKIYNIKGYKDLIVHTYDDDDT
jgi:hypothetical protein